MANLDEVVKGVARGGEECDEGSSCELTPEYGGKGGRHSS